MTFALLSEKTRDGMKFQGPWENPDGCSAELP